MMSFTKNPLTSATGGSLASSKACTSAVNNLYSFASQVSVDCTSALHMLQCFTGHQAKVLLQVMQSRHMSKLVPRFTGGKLRPYT